jgi:hypothetical protein
MTTTAIKEALDSGTEDHEFSDCELSEMFEAAYRRQPDAMDREAGLLRMIRLVTSMA